MFVNVTTLLEHWPQTPPLQCLVGGMTVTVLVSDGF